MFHGINMGSWLPLHYWGHSVCDSVAVLIHELLTCWDCDGYMYMYLSQHRKRRQVLMRCYNKIIIVAVWGFRSMNVKSCMHSANFGSCNLQWEPLYHWDHMILVSLFQRFCTLLYVHVAGKTGSILIREVSLFRRSSIEVLVSEGSPETAPTCTCTLY